MKKIFLLLLLVLFFFFGNKLVSAGALTDFSEKSFRYLLRWEGAREVFDLDEAEAVAVFGETGEAYFL